MVDERVKALINVLVENFRVTISLQVVSGGQLLFNSCKLAEFIHKGGDELWSLV